MAGLLDHLLVSSFVHNEYKSVVVLNGLDGRLSREWVLDHGELVEGVQSLHSLDNDLWSSLLVVNFWSSKCGVSPDLGFLSGMSTFLHSG